MTEQNTDLAALVANIQKEGKAYLNETLEANKKKQEQEQALRNKKEAPLVGITDGVSSYVFLGNKGKPTDKTDLLPVGKIWRVITSYEDFVDYITKNGIPEFLSMDYSLKTAKTGLDCLIWFMQHCIEKGVDKLPPLVFHSALLSHQQVMEQKVDEYGKLKKKAKLQKQ